MPQDPRVDDLRQQLRALGYLDAGVDRFVLGPARGTRRPAAIALLASLRTGLIAALVLGPAAAIGVAGRLPTLMTGPRDAVVIALYLAALFGAGVALLAFVASLAFARLARAGAGRARWLSRGAGLVVGIGCLAYLTLWWQTASAGLGFAAPYWTLSALALAIAISFVVGHAVHVTTSAVVMAGGHADQREATTARRTSWRATAAAAVLAFAGALALMTLTSPVTDRDAVPILTVVSSGIRVRVVAIDGVDPGVFAQLRGTGRVPALDRAFEAAHARLQVDTTRDPARTWTTVATGQPPEIHGVRGLETTRVAGVQGTVATDSRSTIGRAIRTATDLIRLTRPAVASGTERRQKTLWEVATDAGLRTAVVNWWATWPAPADAAGDRGIVLSDRATLRLERGGPLDAEIAPSRLYGALSAEWPALRAAAAAQVNADLPIAAAVDPAVAAILRRSAEIDALQLALASRAATPTTDLVAVYLPGLDIAQHALLTTSEGALGASAAAARIDALEDYYEFLDRLLARDLASFPDHLLVIVTEPGRVASAGDGLLALAGAHVRPGASVTSAASVDVMPTVLHALGVPISRELAGRPLLELFDDDFTRRFPVREVATYGRPTAEGAERKGQPLDQEMIDRLRSLGYVR